MRKLQLILILLGANLLCFAPANNSGEIFRPEPIRKVYSEKDKLQAIIWVESGNDGAGAYSRYEPLAIGILQEWPILVDDCNRIVGYNKYNYNDRLNDRLAIEMFYVYQDYWNPTHDFEIMARLWCGGPEGPSDTRTLPYLQLALNQLYTM